MYRRYAIVAESDLREAGTQLAASGGGLLAGVLGRGAPLWTGALFWQKIP